MKERLHKSEAFQSEHYDAVADERAVVQMDKARFTVLTPRLFRMEWAEDGIFEDHASITFVHRKLDVPEYTVSVREGELLIDTGKAQLRYKISDEIGFSDKNLSVQFFLNGEKVIWKPGMEETGNLGGTNRSLDWWEGDKLHQPLNPRSYVMNEEPMGKGLLSRDGWTLVDNSQDYLFDSCDFSFCEGLNSNWPWVIERQEGVREDWYLFVYGHDYRELLSDYVKISGRIALPPRYAFGIWWTRYTVYSDQEIKDLVKEFFDRNLPLDVFMLDLEWHRAYIREWLQGKLDQSGRGIGFHGYSWNRLLFPAPEQFFSEMHQKGVYIGLNLHPSQGVQPHEDKYQDMCLAMNRNPDEEKYIPLDIVDKEYCENNMKFMHHPTDDIGNDFWWNDHIDGNMSKLSGLQNIRWMNYVLCSDAARRGKRPMAVHRWGGLGSQRYPIPFSGDVFSCWETLKFELQFTSQSANVCAAYWTHDIGGHYPGPVMPELYTRWLQFGVYAPIFRTHCSKNAEAERLIWTYPEPYSGIMRCCYLKRHEQVPYLYTEARRAFDNGVAPLHQMYLDYPEEDNAYHCPEQYMFGQNLIASPVVCPVDEICRTSEKNTWIPPGYWYDMELGEMVQGPCMRTRRYLLSEIPVFQKAGSIIPLQLHSGRVDTKADILGIRIAPAYGTGSSEYCLYEDDGFDRSYLMDENICRTTITASWTDKELDVKILPAEGEISILPEERIVEVILPGVLPPAVIQCRGEVISACEERQFGWWYDCHDLSVHVRLKAYCTAKEQEILLTWKQPRISRRMEGLIGTLKRLKEVYKIVNTTWPAGFPADSLIEAMQTGRRMVLYQENALREVEKLASILPRVVEDIAEQGLSEEEDRIRYADRMGIDVNSKEMELKEKTLKLRFQSANALMREACSLFIRD